MKEERNWMLWNVVSSSPALHTDSKHRNKCVAGCTSTKELLVKHMENWESMCAEACAKMDVWLERTALAFKGDQGFS